MVKAGKRFKGSKPNEVCGRSQAALGLGDLSGGL